MKKKKISYAILVIIFFLVIINTILSYVSYISVSSGNKPKIVLRTKKQDNKVVYYQLLYKIIKEDKDSQRTVSLKLFFLN